MKKEIIDQSAHFLAGLVATLLVSMWVNMFVSGLIVMGFAVLREIYQRVSTGRLWYQCYWGCKLDLLFWALGIVTAIVIKIYGV